MQKNIFLLIAITASTLLAQTPNTLTEKEKIDGWKLLFDGTSTKGWRNYKSTTIKPQWKVIDGALVFS
jgi:hypothetical protein